MNSKFIVGLIIIVLGALAGWYVYNTMVTVGPKKESEMLQVQPTTTPGSEPTSVVGTSAGTPEGTGVGMEKGGVPAAGSVSVSYESSGFAPKIVTVKKGTTVTFSNNTTSGNMWVASAVHPTHQLLPGFDELKSVGPGGSYSYTFVKVGTWQYHNHVNASDTGVVVVTE